MITELDFYPIASFFHSACVTDATCLQGTLTPPDTRSRPIWDLHMHLDQYFFQAGRDYPNHYRNTNTYVSIEHLRRMITSSRSVLFGTPIYSNVETSDILNNTKNE